MNQILAFLVTHLSWIWSDARYRIAGSQVSTSNGGDALLVIESATIRMQLIRDRGQVFLDLQPAHDDAQWYSLSLVRRLLLGRRKMSAVLDAGYARFLEEHLPEIEQRFGRDVWQEAERQLKALRKIRGQELFG